MAETATDARAPELPDLGRAVVTVAYRNAPLFLGTVALSVLYYSLVPGDGNFLVPILIFAGLWLVLFGLNDKIDQRAMERHGQTPVEGRWTAICGTAQPLEDAPGDILACRFQIFDKNSMSRAGTGSKSEQTSCRFDGFYLVPTSIKAPDGLVPLAGFPDLVHLERVSLENDLIARAKASAHRCPNYLPKSVAREFMMAGIRDRAEVCLRYNDEPESGSSVMKAWLLRPSDTVCVFGTWHNGKLVPGKHRPRGLPVYAGSADEVRARLGEDSKAFFWIGAIVLALAAALGIWSFF